MQSGPPMELKVDLGPMPHDDHSGGVIEGLRSLQEKSELCDVVLVVGGESFLAHRAVLAAVSSSFYECLTKLGPSEGLGGGVDSKSLVLKLDDITHPEAVKAMLDCIYRPSTAEYAPSGEDVNRDVLRLAQRFNICQLQDAACRWLTKGLSTSNVLGRLLACEEFDLGEVRERILQLMTANPEALYVLAKDPEITKVPAVLQDLLVRILKLLGCAEPKAEAKAEAKAEPKAVVKAEPKVEPKAEPKAEAKQPAVHHKTAQGRTGRKAGA